MATVELPSRKAFPRERVDDAAAVGFRELAVRALKPLASLKLTVTLFALSIVLVFVGTLAQKDHDVWFVVDQYFHSWIAMVQLQTIERLVQMFAPSVEWNLAGWFPFFGGQTIGLMLIVNLLAAHGVRFKVEATGRRLAVGAVLMAVGVVMTSLVIVSGMNEELVSELSPAFYSFLWQAFRGSLVLVALAGANALWSYRDRLRATEWRVLLAVEIVLASTAAYLLFNPDVRLDNSGLRIMWQLLKGTGAGLVLLAGAALVFRKRAGIVVLHGGIGLMMFSVMWTAAANQESQMSIAEGQSVRSSIDFRSSEFAVVDRSPADGDRVTVVPPGMLEANVGESERIEHADIPVAIKVHRWLTNAQIDNAASADESQATAGAGRRFTAAERPQASGRKGDERNSPAAFVELFTPSGESLGTFLLSVALREQTVDIAGKPYDVALRYKEIHYPYSLTLKDFNKHNYTGTGTAKNFESLVQLRDPERNIDQEVRIWMNNPLRYAGTTFYQASWDEATEKGTVLQVMSNPSWMAPYVACMLVATGMLAHFGAMLLRFLRRRAEEANSAFAPYGSAAAVVSPVFSPTSSQAAARKGAEPAFELEQVRGWRGVATKWFPAFVVIVFALYMGSKARMPKSTPSAMQIEEFGKLPISYQGRIKPYDTLARNSLQFLSGRQELMGEPKTSWLAKLMNRREKGPAIVWLLDSISGTEASGNHRVFRIDNLDLLNALDLEVRSELWLYSWNEIHAKEGELDKQIRLAAEVKDTERSLYQRKVVDLAIKRSYFDQLTGSFLPVQLFIDPENFDASAQKLMSAVTRLRSEKDPPPHVVPPNAANVQWSPLLLAEVDEQVLGRPRNEAVPAVRGLLTAYVRNDATTFNRQLLEYRRVLNQYEKSLGENVALLRAEGVKPAELYSRKKTGFEWFFNHFSPFYYCMALYIAAFVLGAASWLGWSVPLRKASIGLLWFTFAIHTLALVGRIYVSGRPPVTNLYSSAVFIGWGAVLLALILEAIYRLGLGNIVAAVSGFLTLFIAHKLSLDGDTLIVLQAVLDTQFWLATHVVCITLGYTTTYLAGMFGILYVLLVHVFPVLETDQRRQLTRMTYGTLCFAILFSFVGTVLGGLWGDDSWGRFWGWDPKENGALIIVLYNALVLHARWGALVKERGLALLAIGGNIVVTWSWFGVNELGVGLHAYGASESSTAMWLLVFAASQLAIIAIGAMPRAWFAALSRPTVAAR